MNFVVYESHFGRVGCVIVQCGGAGQFSVGLGTGSFSLLFSSRV